MGSQVHVALYVLGRLKDFYNLLGPRETSGSQVHVALHVLSRLKGTCNLLGPSYTSGSHCRE